MPRKHESPWFVRAAELIVREGKPYKTAFSELGVTASEGEMTRIFNSKPFQEVLWEERHRMHREIAKNPERSKEAAIGMAVLAIQRLADKGEWKEVLEGVLKLSKMEGWVGAEQNIQIFQNLTAKDIEAAKKQILEIQDRAQVERNTN